jgi:hypothetical protein
MCVPFSGLDAVDRENGGLAVNQAIIAELSAHGIG